MFHTVNCEKQVTNYLTNFLAVPTSYVKYTARISIGSLIISKEIENVKPHTYLMAKTRLYESK